ncbi:helix-turn-helix domain-containing protein [Roseivirga sp.]|uniref:helix-turn-helix domain-containing protein n=1 Tax=Roseivirga sp. TaxID=1964215 RepID=UPI003B8BCC14
MIGYQGQHTVHLKGGQIYWRAEHGEMQGINNGFALFSSKNLLGEHQKTRLSLRFGLKGTQQYHIEDAQLNVNRNQFLVMNEGTEYDVVSQNNEETTMLAFCFNENFVSDYVNFQQNTTDKLLDENGLYNLNGHTPEFPLHTLGVSEKLSSQIQSIINVKQNFSSDIVDDYSIFNEVLSMIFCQFNDVFKSFDNQEIVKKSTKVELYKRLSIARDYIQAHFTENINLNELSRVACLSPFHFHRAFKQTFKITPKQFVTYLRIEYAKWLLINQKTSVQSVCQAVGFRDVSSFTRLFTSRTGTTPSAFRKKVSGQFFAV